MPYAVETGVLDVSFKCSACGHSGTKQVEELEEVVGNYFTVGEFTCPKCGATLSHDGNGFLDWEDDDYEEFQSVGKLHPDDYEDDDDEDEDDE